MECRTSNVLVTPGYSLVVPSPFHQRSRKRSFRVARPSITSGDVVLYGREEVYLEPALPPLGTFLRGVWRT